MEIVNFAERAEFSNTNGFLISQKIKVIDERGVLSADQLIRCKQNLDIVSFDKTK